nr:integrase, catalytic region, zinc finger, CCHC-type, peptidase aspartic, catalytic [Tanacetum cinerariifolium]
MGTVRFKNDHVAAFLGFGDLQWGNILITRKFLGTVRFGNDHVAAILGFDDLQWGNILITRVYFVEGLGHNLFSVGQFCDSDLEPKFTKPKKVEHHKSLATSKPRKPRFLLRWSPTGRMFNQEGKLDASSNSESQNDCSNGDNACTSNAMELKIKPFPNSTSLLDSDSEQEDELKKDKIYIMAHESNEGTSMCLVLECWNGLQDMDMADFEHSKQILTHILHLVRGLILFEKGTKYNKTFKLVNLILHCFNPSNVSHGFLVKDKQEKDKIETKPDENGKRGKARRCQKSVTVEKAEKRRNTDSKDQYWQILKIY